MTRLEAREGSSYPGNWALGVVDDVELTRAVAGAMASDLAGAGINLDFAPVADVNTTADNPIIGVRSFGSDAELVARHVAAFVDRARGGRRRRVRQALPGARRHAGGLAPGAADGRHAAAGGAASVPRGDRRRRDGDHERPHPRPRDRGRAGHAESRAAHRPAARRARIHGRGDHRRAGDEGDQRHRGRGAGSSPGAGRGRRRALPRPRPRRRLGRADRRCCGRRRRGGAARRSSFTRRRDQRSTRAEADSPSRGVGAARCPAGRPSRGRRAPDATRGRRRAAAGADDRRRRPQRRAGRARSRHACPTRESLHEPMATPSDGQLVVVLQDAHRHEWQRDAATTAASQAAPDAIVVEVGLPVWRPGGAAGYVATHGAARVNVEAAVDRLLGAT